VRERRRRLTRACGPPRRAGPIAGDEVTLQPHATGHEQDDDDHDGDQTAVAGAFLRVHLAVGAFDDLQVLVELVDSAGGIAQVEPFLAEPHRVLLAEGLVPGHAEADVTGGIEEVALGEDLVQVHAAAPEDQQEQRIDPDDKADGQADGVAPDLVRDPLIRGGLHDDIRCHGHALRDDLRPDALVRKDL